MIEYSVGISQKYPHDADGALDGLVLSVHGFNESDPGNLHVCKEYYLSLLSNTIPDASLAKTAFGLESTRPSPGYDASRQWSVRSRQSTCCRVGIKEG